MGDIELEKIFSLYIDADTLHGLKRSIPVLLELFEKYTIKTTFFVTVEPDTSGKNF